MEGGGRRVGRGFYLPGENSIGMLVMEEQYLSGQKGNVIV
jgi:hypothetical protein